MKRLVSVTNTSTGQSAQVLANFCAPRISHGQLKRLERKIRPGVYASEVALTVIGKDGWRGEIPMMNLFDIVPEARIKKLKWFLSDLNGVEDATTNDEALIDLLTDVRHLCDSLNIDLFSILDTSYKHYLEEKKENQSKDLAQHAISFEKITNKLDEAVSKLSDIELSECTGE